MVEYTVDTLVHLYDSLNSEIEKIHEELSTSYQYAVNPADDRARQEIENVIRFREIRLNKLAQMRDNVEDILSKIFEVEAKEVK